VASSLLDRAPREVVLAAFLAAGRRRDQRRILGCRPGNDRHRLGRRRIALHEGHLIRALVGFAQIVVVELVARPEQPASHQVKIAGIRDRIVVVSDRGAEAARTLRFVGPDHDRNDFLGAAILVFDHLLAGGQGMGVEDVYVVI